MLSAFNEHILPLSSKAVIEWSSGSLQFVLEPQKVCYFLVNYLNVNLQDYVVGYENLEN